MNFKNITGIAILVVAVAFSIHLVQQPQVEARQTQSNSRRAVQYATLSVEDGGANVTWLIGGNQPVRTESVRAAFQRLGGTGPNTFSDLLNQIGSQGWNLVQKDGDVWIFSR